MFSLLIESVIFTQTTIPKPVGLGSDDPRSGLSVRLGSSFLSRTCPASIRTYGLRPISLATSLSAMRSDPAAGRNAARRISRQVVTPVPIVPNLRRSRRGKDPAKTRSGREVRSEGAQAVHNVIR